MGSIRNYYLAKELSYFFESRTTVFSTSNSNVLPKDQLSLDGFDIFNLPTIDYRSFANSSSTAGVSEKGGPLRQFLRRLKNSLPFSIVLGLGGPLFLISSIWKGYFFLRKNKTAVVLSLSEPFIDHIIASILKKIFPRIIWIADIQNLALEPDTDRVILKGFQHWCYKKILQKANVISTVSEGLVPHLKRYNLRVEVIELGIGSMYELRRFRPTEKFTISYCGSLYPEQNFDVLLSAVKDLVLSGILDKDEIQFQYAGTNLNIWNKHLDGFGLLSLSKNIGSISYQKSKEILATSDLNLLLTWNTLNFKTIIPGKYYDYLSVLKPILMIIHGERDEDWESRFKDLQPGFMCYSDEVDPLKQYLISQIRLWRSKSDNSLNLNKKLLDQHLIKNQAAKLLKYIT